jgi:hypothetical protein
MQPDLESPGRAAQRCRPGGNVELFPLDQAQRLLIFLVKSCQRRQHSKPIRQPL